LAVLELQEFREHLTPFGRGNEGQQPLKYQHAGKCCQDWPPKRHLFLRGLSC
jgi:hypothetical protein